MYILSDSSGLSLVMKCFIDPVVQEATTYTPSYLITVVTMPVGRFRQKKSADLPVHYMPQSSCACCLTEWQCSFKRELDQSRVLGCSSQEPPGSPYKHIELPAAKIPMRRKTVA